jgi:succinate dehydrogenase / fumarate reductase flavoprotein subunit
VDTRAPTARGRPRLAGNLLLFSGPDTYDEGRGIGETGLSVYLDFADAIGRLGVEVIRGGLQPDVDDPGAARARGESFSDHGANRLGASALMQGGADGYFVIPCTLANSLASTPLAVVTTGHEAFREAEASIEARTQALLSVKGRRTPREIHRELGKLLWEYVGMSPRARTPRPCGSSAPSSRTWPCCRREIPSACAGRWR